MWCPTWFAVALTMTGQSHFATTCFFNLFLVVSHEYFRILPFCWLYGSTSKHSASVKDSRNTLSNFYYLFLFYSLSFPLMCCLVQRKTARKHRALKNPYAFTTAFFSECWRSFFLICIAICEIKKVCNFQHNSFYNSFVIMMKKIPRVVLERAILGHSFFNFTLCGCWYRNKKILTPNSFDVKLRVCSTFSYMVFCHLHGNIAAQAQSVKWGNNNTVFWAHPSIKT